MMTDHRIHRFIPIARDPSTTLTSCSQQ